MTDPIDDVTRPMLGLVAWGVKHGHGSFLTFEFGTPALRVTERLSSHDGLRRSAYVHGQWKLWIECCHWRICHGDTAIAHSEDTNELIGRAVAMLNGQKLFAITADPASARSLFRFDLGGALKTWPYGNDPAEVQWSIYADDHAFQYRADGYYSWQRSDTPPDRIDWLPSA